MNRFEEVYLSATEIEKNMGRLWYSDQHNYLKGMSEHFDVPLNVVCGITAALSPMVSWQLNVNMVYHVLKFRGNVPKNVKMPGFKSNVKKAIKIYKKRAVFPHLNGPKVTQFYENLLNPFNSDCVTIDTFMLACYYDIQDKTQLRKYSSEKNIEVLKNEVKTLSEKHSLLPLQFQAIVWLAYHRIVKSMQSYGSQLTLKIF
jgi:hypothetical protein